MAITYEYNDKMTTTKNISCRCGDTVEINGLKYKAMNTYQIVPINHPRRSAIMQLFSRLFRKPNVKDQTARETGSSASSC